jgi:hypothetical protein
MRPIYEGVVGCLSLFFWFGLGLTWPWLFVWNCWIELLYNTSSGQWNISIALDSCSIGSLAQSPTIIILREYERSRPTRVSNILIISWPLSSYIQVQVPRPAAHPFQIKRHLIIRFLSADYPMPRDTHRAKSPVLYVTSLYIYGVGQLFMMDGPGVVRNPSSMLSNMTNA